MASMAIDNRGWRFLLAGAVNTGFGLAFYPLLVWTVPLMHKHYLLALGIAQVVCLCFAYSTYKLGVFRTRGNTAREFGAFSGFYLFTYAVNWAVLPLLVTGAGVPPAVAQLAFTLCTVVGSWFWHTRVTFKDSEPHR